MADKRTFLIVAGGLLFLSATAWGQGERQRARAVLIDARRAQVGSATLTQADAGVKIALKISGLAPGVHAFHIHAVGQCDPPDFKSAGGHFNPHGKRHGLNNPEGAHAGDLPNIVVGPDGSAEVELMAPGLTLGEGEHSLFHPGGTALVIHANPDDDLTDPAGNAGERIACGVIVR